MIAINNGLFFKDNELVANDAVLLNEGKITALTNGAIPDGYYVIDAQDNYVVPGFIDLQIYGAGGRLFSADPTTESLRIIEQTLLTQGTTGFLLCLATNTPAVFNAAIQAMKQHRPNASNCLGLHLEGPFLNPKKRGAHIENLIRRATLDEVKTLLDFGDGVIKMMTIAPETQDEEVINYLLDNGVVVSLGHSDATFAEASAAFDRGIQTTTHLFNAMSPIHHRQPGIPSAVFNHNQAMASIIADGHHVDFEVVKFSQQILKERLFLITDAVTSCNTGPYQHQLTDGKYVMPDGTLSGSALTMPQAVKNCVDCCAIPLPSAINMATKYPAKLMGIDHLVGAIKVGYQANLLLLNTDLELKEVIFRGEKVG